MVHVHSNVTMSIQKSKRTERHVDKLKCCQGDAPESWLPKLPVCAGDAGSSEPPPRHPPS